MKKPRPISTTIFASVFTVGACITTVYSPTSRQKTPDQPVDNEQKLADERADYIILAAEKLRQEATFDSIDPVEIRSQVMVITINSTSLSEDTLPRNLTRMVLALGAVQRLVADHPVIAILPRAEFGEVVTSEHFLNGILDRSPGNRQVARRLGLLN